MRTKPIWPTTGRPRRPEPVSSEPGAEAGAKGSLSGEITRRLEEDILRGRVLPGHRLEERELSARYDVSRTPIREALQRLSASGLAVARGRQGLQVAQLSVADLLDAFSVVAELEALAAAQAARRILTEQEAALTAAHQACGCAVSSDDADAFYDANMAFHDAVATASHNRILQEELRRMCLKTAPYRRAITFQPGRMSSSHPEHGAVMEAILARNALKASDLMRRHLSLLSEGVADFLRFVRGSPHAGLFEHGG